MSSINSAGVELCFEKPTLDLCGEWTLEGQKGAPGNRVGLPLSLPGETVTGLVCVWGGRAWEYLSLREQEEIDSYKWRRLPESLWKWAAFSDEIQHLLPFPK